MSKTEKTKPTAIIRTVPHVCLDCLPRMQETIGEAECLACPHCPQWYKTDCLPDTAEERRAAGGAQ